MGISNIKRRARIKYSIRNKVVGTAERPRLTVFRSNKAIYAQLIDDKLGHTIASASSKDSSITSGTKTEVSAAVGKLLAEKANAAGVSKAVFDRNGYRFHGRVKALADGAVENGLKF